MKGCKYQFKGSDKWISYSELIEEISKRPDIQSANDIVFSKSPGEILRDKIYNELQALKLESFNVGNATYDNGEPEIAATGTIGTQAFIDSPSFVDSEGHRHITAENNQQFIERRTEQLKEEDKSLSTEDAKKLATIEKNNFDIVGSYAKQLHGLLSKLVFKGN